ncbi:alcohol dehydrogenase catalytic domain-containing protein [Naumannella halotolerans]|uniref:alcohol dehydrogenase n=1 Tax=Naumannella halotolerans TaxID=993414 RepID=A0A4R7J9A3_9ACTN|nr:alcohol dehydrogenase catalytic domain-containing protein [Naumannella halotolerans]TDT33884.1 propanol-preferring alcohol dehydrogenase [Naumannella halotolerans]
MSTTMMANTLDSPAPLDTDPLEWRSIAVPEPGEGQVLIEVAACGVCRSNLHMVVGDWAADGVPGASPIVPGHEVTGRIAGLGPGVEDFVVGDPVGVQPLWWTCEECEFCRTGREQLCHQRVITGEHVDGGYAEFMLANARHTYPVPAGLDLVAAAPLFCPGITAFGAVEKLGIEPGQSVAVFGLGGVGHMAVQFAALAGAEVIAVGRNDEHLAVAADLGATRLVNTTRGEVEGIADSMDGVLTFAGVDSVTAMAMASLKWGGTLVNAVPVNIDGFPFNKGQTIKGSLLGNRAQMAEVLRLAAEGRIRTVTESFDLSEAGNALRQLEAGELRSRAVLVNGTFSG